MAGYNRSLNKGHYHSVYKLYYHLVLVTKYRHKCLTSEMLEALQEQVAEICSANNIRIEEFNGEANHIHILMEAHPSIDLSKFVNGLKSGTSRRMRKIFSEELKPYYWKPVFWKRGYCLVTAGGAPISILKKIYRRSRYAKLSIHPHLK